MQRYDKVWRTWGQQEGVQVRIVYIISTLCPKKTMFLLLNSLKCVVTEVVMFSVVAFKTLDISQGSVATHLRCGGIFIDSLITYFLLILKVK